MAVLWTVIGGPGKGHGVKPRAEAVSLLRLVRRGGLQRLQAALRSAQAPRDLAATASVDALTSRESLHPAQDLGPAWPGLL